MPARRCGKRELAHATPAAGLPAGVWSSFPYALGNDRLRQLHTVSRRTHTSKMRRFSTAGNGREAREAPGAPNPRLPSGGARGPPLPSSHHAPGLGRPSIGRARPACCHAKGDPDPGPRGGGLGERVERQSPSASSAARAAGTPRPGATHGLPSAFSGSCGQATDNVSGPEMPTGKGTLAHEAKGSLPFARSVSLRQSTEL